MAKSPDRLRLASYNLHKCRGMTGPYAPERNLRVIAEIGADVIALQEVDFSGTSEQIKSMNNFYTKLNEAMADLGDSLEDTKQYKDQLSALNRNLGSLNSVYGNVLSAMASIGKD